MPPQLPAGHYDGEIQASRQIDGLFLTETAYESRSRVPEHSHVNGPFSLSGSSEVRLMSVTSGMGMVSSQVSCEGGR